MDRPLDPSIRKRTFAKRVTLLTLASVGAIAALMGASSLMRPSIERGRILTAKVDVGPIEATITASGTVVPELLQVLSSPVEARVVRILRRSGAAVARGEPIVELDLSAPVLALDRLRQDLALKENQQARTRLELESTVSGLEGQIEIKRLELQNAKSVSERNRKLFEEGLVSEELLRQSQLDEARTAVELKQLEQAEAIARRSNGTQLRGLLLEMETLRREASEAARQIELGTTKSDRNGVVTWTVAEEGVTVHKGEILARIADLTAFRVDATISDVHAGRVRAGMPAHVDLGGTVLEGSVSRVLPTIQNGVVSLAVRLEDPANAILRSNLRVDVLLVTGGKGRALRLKKGTFGENDGLTEVFVVRGATAVRTPVRFGASTLDRYEVLAGLTEGDEVIVSDTRNIQHLKEVRIR